MFRSVVLLQSFSLAITPDSFAIINLNFVLLALEYINVIETSMHDLKQTF